MVQASRFGRSVVVLNAFAAALLLPSMVPASTSSDAAPAWVAVDRAAEAGLAAVDKSWAATPVDYDADGDEDVWIGYHQWSGKLWSNDGDGTYTWVAPNAWRRWNAEGNIPDRHDCKFADVDLDGRPDAYCSAGRNMDDYVKYGKDNELWLQLRSGHFTEVGTAWGVGDVCGRGRHVAFLDANGDEYPDLFVGNMSGRSVGDPCDDSANGLPSEKSKLFLNVGGTHFVEDPASGITGDRPGQQCAKVFDFDNDGWDDLLTCQIDAPPHLFRNLAGHGLADVATERGIGASYRDLAPVDLEPDGDIDLVFTDNLGTGILRNNGGYYGPAWRFATNPARVWGRSVAVGDVDGNGTIDVFQLRDAITGNPDDVLYLNFLKFGGKFTPVPVPAAGGRAEEVVALHPDANGRTQFLVLNGRDDLKGPVQLITVQGHVASAEVAAAAAVPGAPSVSGVVAGVDQVVVSFTTPGDGGSSITGFTATCVSGDGAAKQSVSGTASPLTVTGLTTATAYTCSVVATNMVGTGPASAPSAGVVVPIASSPAAIARVSPATGRVSGATSVTIAGTGFTGAIAVAFGGVAAASYTVTNDTTISAITPAHAAGRVDVVVTTASGASLISGADQFTFLPTPTVSGVSPNAGPAAGGTTVTIKGTGFTGATGVTFGAAAASSYTVANDTTITAVSPAHATGQVDVHIATPNGTTTTSAADHYTYQNVTESPPLDRSPR